MFYRNQGDAGGGDAGADPAVDSGTNAADNSGDGTGQKSNGGEKTGDGTTTDLTPEQQLEQYKTDLTKAAEENAGLKSQLGKQSDQIGTLNKISKMMKDNPKELAERLGKSGGFKIASDVADGEIDIQSILSGESSPDKFNKYLESRDAKTRNDVMKEVNQQLGPLHEANMAARHSDWDDRATDRSNLDIMVTTGQITNPELYHYASIGMDMPKALEAAGTKAVEEYVISLQEKAKGQITGTSTTNAKAPAGEQRVENFLPQLGRR